MMNPIQKRITIFVSAFFRQLAQMSLLLLSLAINGPAVLHAQSTSLNVTNFGARGDAIQSVVTTTGSSSVVIFPATNPLSHADVGKIILLFGVGPATTTTNNQDLIASIVSVSDGTNITISGAASLTSTQVFCTYGTQNAGAFQNCIDASTGTNALIQIPAGNYLLIPPSQLDPELRTKDFWSWRTALLIQKGGLHFMGPDRERTILTGCGAWNLYAGAVQRGWMFLLLGPVTNDAPLIFENLTMDGGVQQGHTARDNSGPAWTTDGDGWDVTHDAVVDGGNNPLHAYKVFQNCSFVHWRGEMVKSVASFDSGLIVVTNCLFSDGNGSGFNFNWTPHVITGCLFSNLDMAMEYYVGTMQSSSVFKNSTLTGLRQAIVLVGGLTNHPSPGYTIQNNVISNISASGVLMGPACNVRIIGNQFTNVTFGINTDGYAYQGTDYNHDIAVLSNSFNQVYYVINIGGGGVDRLENMTVTSNQATNCHQFACGYGWSTNVMLQSNASVNSYCNLGDIGTGSFTGQWFLDDSSDQLPLYMDAGYPGTTNLISYANGMKHSLANTAEGTNILFCIDDRTPAQIPPGARLSLTNLNRVPVNIMLSLRNPGAGTVVLQANSWLRLIFINNSFMAAPLPPSNLRTGGNSQ